MEIRTLASLRTFFPEKLEIRSALCHNLNIIGTPKFNKECLIKEEESFKELFQKYFRLSDNYILGLPKEAQEEAGKWNECFKEKIIKIVRQDENLAKEFLKHKINKIESAGSIEPERRMDELYNSLWNLGKVDKKILRGSQPSELDLKWLKKMGTGRVINLRRENSYDYSPETTTKDEEKETCIKLGLDYKEFPMDDSESKPPTKEMIQKALDCIKESRVPVFVHCAGGLGRTGMVLAAYRMQVCGWSLNKALTEAEEYGFISEMRQNQVKVLQEFEINPPSVIIPAPMLPWGDFCSLEMI